jgi:amino acid adenylation domain-containing protein
MTPAPTPAEFATIVEALAAHARTRPHKTAFRFATASGAIETLTFAELHRRACGVAASLSRVAKAGERALLLYDSGLEIVVALLGTFIAGLVAVPARPPRSPDGRGGGRIRAIARSCRPALTCTAEAVAARLPPELVKATWMLTDRLDSAASAELSLSPPRPGDLAMLQYTSGSTSAPKGVMLTHANIAANQVAIRDAFGQDDRSVVVSWLPLHHDMGLIGGLLQPLYLGAEATLMDPAVFLRRPRRWLDLITRYRATTSGGPNLAYELCIQRVDTAELADLDLSTWTVAFNGSEPVRPATIERFSAKFAAAGFRREAFLPCYGLAEATLIVTGGPPGRGPRFLRRAEPPVEAIATDAGAVAACGRTLPSIPVALVDPETMCRVPDGRIGEIWVAGPGVAQGYWDSPERTRETFEATLADEPHLRFLRTGDLGFRADGELAVAGRLKDLVIVGGRNVHPEDIERTVGAVSAHLRAGMCAAFGVADQTGERLVVVQEVRPEGVAEAETLKSRIAEAVWAEHEISATIMLVSPGTIRRTDNGKIQRHATRRLWLAGALGNAGAGVPFDPAQATPDAVRAYVRAALQALGGSAPAGDDDGAAPLAAWSIDSMQALRLFHRLEEDLGIPAGGVGLAMGASLSEVVDSVLAALRRPRAEGRAERTAAGTDGGEYEATAAQQALWLLDQTSLTSGAFNIAVAFELRGALDPEGLAWAVDQVVHRHPILSSSFEPRDGKLICRPRAHGPVAIQRIDASNLDAGSLAGALGELANRRFQLSAEPPLRAALYQLARDRAVLAFAASHLAADMWSARIIWQELLQLYGDWTAGRLERADPPTTDFAAFARWQRDWLASEEGVLAGRLACARLREAGASHELLTDRERTALASRRAATCGAHLDARRSMQLTDFAKAAGLTPATVFLSALAIGLARQRDARDVSIGVPASGRRAGRFARTVGCLTNTVVVAQRLAGSASLRDVLDETARALSAAAAQEDYPFSRLVEALRPPRQPGTTPLFSTMFVFHDAAEAASRTLNAAVVGAADAGIEVSGVRFVPFAIDRGTAQVDLTVTIAQVAEGFRIRFDYDADLFAAETIATFRDSYLHLLGELQRQPETSVGRVPLREPDAETRLMERGRATAPCAPRDPESSLTSRFAAVARARPDRIAVSCDGRSLTYAELDARASQGALRLRERGVRPGAHVAVCVERSLDLAIAILAVLKAGAAYVPLDPSDPEERRRFLAADAAACLLVTAPASWSEPAALPCPLLFTADLLGSPPGQDDRAASLPPATPPADAPAYMIYTSGSTGSPKGVLVSHDSVLRLVDELATPVGPREDDVWWLFHSIAFDVSVYEMWGAWLSGAQLVVVPYWVSRSPRALSALVDRERITMLTQTPTAFFDLLSGGWPREGRRVRALLFAGESLNLRQLGDWREPLGEAAPRVFNLYGPTETTVYMTCREIIASDIAEARAGAVGTPIGEPLADTDLHLLDSAGNLVGRGVPGEIHIGGPGLGIGYWKAPERTAEQFVPDPFSPVPGARLYRSGDRAVRRSNGDVYILGRMDRQTKIRGVRVEPDEVAFRLEGDPAVARAFVSRVSTPGGNELVAYVVPRTEGVTAPALRASLARRLPAAMIPRWFVFLDALPTSRNGKVDEARLPRFVPESEPRPPAPAPDQAMERMLVGIWRDVLGTTAFDLQDSFFDVGGHSLLMAQVGVRIERHTGQPIAMVDLYRFPTIASLANHLRARGLVAPEPDASL